MHKVYCTSTFDLSFFGQKTLLHAPKKVSSSSSAIDKNWNEKLVINERWMRAKCREGERKWEREEEWDSERSITNCGKCHRKLFIKHATFINYVQRVVVVAAAYCWLLLWHVACGKLHKLAAFVDRGPVKLANCHVAKVKEIYYASTKWRRQCVVVASMCCCCCQYVLLLLLPVVVMVVVVWGIVILDRQNTQLDCPLKFAAFV